MKYYTTDKDLDDYNDSEAVNQSSLKIIIKRGILSYKKEMDENRRIEEEGIVTVDKRYFAIGKVVDFFLTELRDGVVPSSRFYVSTATEIPGEKARSVLDLAFNSINRSTDSTDLESYRKEIYEASNSLEYYNNRKSDSWEEDTRYVRLKEKGGDEYWKSLIMSRTKCVIMEEDRNLAVSLVQKIRNDEKTSYLFNDREEVDHYFQTCLYSVDEDTGLTLKGKPDHVIVDRKSKRIYIIDYKTSVRPILEFNKAIEDLRYDIQLSFYRNLVIKNPDKFRIDSIDDYSTSTSIVAVSTGSISTPPLQFVLDRSLMTRAELGQDFSTGYSIMGWREALFILNKWKKVNFDVSEVFKSGVIVLNTDNYKKQIY